MTPIEIMALIVALLVLIKIIIILTKPSSWMNIVKPVYGNPVLTTIISVAIAITALFYLTKELTIVHIFAVMFFMMPLIAIGVTAYSKDILALANKLLRDKVIVREAWIAIAIWIILLVWLFYELFL